MNWASSHLANSPVELQKRKGFLRVKREWGLKETINEESITLGLGETEEVCQ